MDKYTKLKTVEDLNNWLSRNYTKEQLEYIQAEANNPDSPLYFYFGEGYRAYNRCLRKNLEKSQTDYDIEGLQKMICSFSTTENLVAYRYISKDEFSVLTQNTYSKKEYVYPCFMSTTLLNKLYNVQQIIQGRKLIKIYIPKGTHGMYIPDIFPDSPEYEFLLPYRIKLKRKWLKSFIVV